MKILMINKFVYPKGGDAISMLTTGKLLEEKGHQVIYWGMDHPDNPPYKWEKNLLLMLIITNQAVSSRTCQML